MVQRYPRAQGHGSVGGGASALRAGASCARFHSDPAVDRHGEQSRAGTVPVGGIRLRVDGRHRVRFGESAPCPHRRQHPRRNSMAETVRQHRHQELGRLHRQSEHGRPARASEWRPRRGGVRLETEPRSVGPRRAADTAGAYRRREQHLQRAGFVPSSGRMAATGREHNLRNGEGAVQRRQSGTVAAIP